MKIIFSWIYFRMHTHNKNCFISNISTRLNQEGRYVLDFEKMTPTIGSSSAYNFCRPGPGPIKTFADQA